MQDGTPGGPVPLTVHAMETIRDPRVAFLASTLATGGAERVVESLACGLPRRGVETRVFCLRPSGEIGDAIAAAGVRLTPGIARFRRDPLAAARLAALLRGWRPDVLVSLDHHDAIVAGALARAFGGSFRLVLMVHSTGLWGNRATFSWIDRLALPSFDRIVALARSHERYLVEREGVDSKRIAIVANGVDTGRFVPAGSPAERIALRGSLGIGEGDFAAAIVAGLRPEKNHAMFLRAAARVRGAHPRSTFLIVGEGAEEGNLRALAADLFPSGGVRFLGRREDVPSVLAACDALALASHPVVETFPLVVLEAMSCGLPVAVTDVGSVREMLVDGEEGFIVSSGDEAALAEKLLFLASRPDEARRMGERGRERVKRDFTVGAMISGYETLVRGLAPRG